MHKKEVKLSVLSVCDGRETRNTLFACLLCKSYLWLPAPVSFSWTRYYDNSLQAALPLTGEVNVWHVTLLHCTDQFIHQSICIISSREQSGFACILFLWIIYLQVSGQCHVTHISGPWTESWSSFKRKLLEIEHTALYMMSPSPLIHNEYLGNKCKNRWCSYTPDWPVISFWACCEGWQSLPLWSCQCSNPMKAWSSETLWWASSMSLYPAKSHFTFRCTAKTEQSMNSD